MNIYQKDHTQVPVLFTLIREHRNEEVRAHLKLHPEEVNLKGWMDNTPVLEAASAGNEEIVELLLKKGADVNSPRSGVYRLPVCWAKTRRIAELMFAHGAEMNGEELSYATRGDNLELIELFLAHGATLNREEPEYLLCHSAKAVEAYRAGGIDIAQPGKYGRNLLHHAAMKDSPELFDYAFDSGVPYRKDQGFKTPYYTAGKDGKLRSHLREKYPQFSKQRIIAAEWNSANANFIVDLRKVPGADGVFIALTRNSDLLRFRVTGTDLVREAVVNVDVPPARNFAFNEAGQIILPSGEDQLLLIDPQTFELKARIRTEYDSLVQITALPRHGRYLGSSTAWKAYILDEQFRLLKEQPLRDGLFFPIINKQETMVSLFSYDQACYHHLYTIDANGNLGDHLYTFYEDNERNVCIDDDYVFTGSGKALNAYRWVNSEPQNVWEVKTSPLKAAPSIQAVFILNAEQLLVVFGSHLLLVSRASGNMEGDVRLELEGEIKGLLADKESNSILVWSDSQVVMTRWR